MRLMEVIVHSLWSVHDVITLFVVVFIVLLLVYLLFYFQFYVGKKLGEKIFGSVYHENRWCFTINIITKKL